MPKSKRNRFVHLTATKKKSFSEIKEKLVQKVRDSCDQYERIFIYSVQHMKNFTAKEVRQQWSDSRFFFGKNKVMAFGLGPTKETEYKDNLHKISQRLRGECGLLFTNRSRSEVLELLDNKIPEFMVTIEAVWESDGYFEEYIPTDKSTDNQISSVEPEVKSETKRSKLRKNKFNNN